jgi:hypothetical protein
MSYDLYFWREQEPGGKTPQQMMNAFQEDGPQEGVATWPRDAVIGSFRSAFPDTQDEGNQLIWEGAGSGFNVEFSYSDEKHIKLIIVLCGWKLLDSPDTMNQIIAVGNGLGCALYDPQNDQRYA